MKPHFFCGPDHYNVFWIIINKNMNLKTFYSGNKSKAKFRDRKKCISVLMFIKKSNKKELTSSHLMNFSPSSKALGTSIGLSVMLADLELVDIVNNKHNYAETITPANL